MKKYKEIKTFNASDLPKKVLDYLREYTTNRTIASWYATDKLEYDILGIWLYKHGANKDERVFIDLEK